MWRLSYWVVTGKGTLGLVGCFCENVNKNSIVSFSDHITWKNGNIRMSHWCHPEVIWNPNKTASNGDDQLWVSSHPGMLGHLAMGATLYLGTHSWEALVSTAQMLPSATWGQLPTPATTVFSAISLSSFRILCSSSACRSFLFSPWPLLMPSYGKISE